MQHVFERVQFLRRPRSEVFAFFSDARNLERITPPSMHFAIETPLPIEMKEGAIIEYTISLFGVPIPWRTRIEAFEPDDRFVDLQLRGPYRRWHHTHTFSDTHDGGTRMKDRVEYEVPFGPLGEVARLLFVRRQLDLIFDHRRATIAELFG